MNVPGNFVSRELIEANLSALEIVDEARELASNVERSKLHKAEAALETARAEAAAAVQEVERRERSD